MTRPVFSAIVSAMPGVSLSLSQMPAVRRHCQTMALYTGSPVALSHRIVVSRWFVMPMPAMRASGPSLRSTCAATLRWLSQSSSGSCSTQPGCG